MKKKVLSLGSMTGLLLSLAYLSGCYPAEEGAEGAANGATTIMFIVILVLFIAFFWFFMIRPQRRRQKEHEQLVQALKVGDRVVTVGGIYGNIESLSDESLVLKVESGATIRIARTSIVVKRSR